MKWRKDMIRETFQTTAFCFGLIVAGLTLTACGTDSSDVSSFRPAPMPDGQEAGVVAEAREYRDARGNRAFLLDMIHVGPQSYYDGIKSYIADLVAKRPDLIVLMEGVTCFGQSKTDAVTIRNPTRFDPTLMPGHGAGTVEEALAAVGATTFQDISRVESSGFLEMVTCSQLSRERTISGTYEDTATSLDLATQASQRLFPRGTPVHPADLDLSKLSPGEKLVFGSFISCLAEERCAQNPLSMIGWMSYSPTPQAKAFQAVINHVILDKRNQAVQTALEAAAKPGSRAILMPWGEAHMKDLYVRLERMGFSLVDTREVPLASCRKIVGNELLQSLFGPFCT